MAATIDITYVCGAYPFTVYVCDVFGSNCYYLGTITVSTTLPVSYSLPPAFTAAPAVMVKVIDDNGCEEFHIQNCTTPTPTPTPSITPTNTPTPTETPTNTPTPTPTQTPGLSPSVTPTQGQTQTPTPTSTNTPTPTITPTITPTASAPAFFAYVFAEPKDSTSQIDLGTFMVNNGSILFYGYGNTGVPAIAATYSSDLNVYAHYSGFTLGSSGNFITPVSTFKSPIWQGPSNTTDSYGCNQPLYTFGTIEITTSQVNPNIQYFYSIWIPLNGVGGSMNNMTISASIGAPCVGNIFFGAIPEPSQAGPLGDVVVTSGAAIPAGTYRVLWVDPNLNQPSLPPPALNASIYIKGEHKY